MPLRTLNLDRRAFLKSILAAGLSSLTLGARDLFGDGGSRRERIVVVGAGMAGLSAATHLAAAGQDVVVLEGSSRSGGRMFTDRTLGMPIDLGASWIEGVAGNPIADLARRFRLSTSRTDYDDLLAFDSEGRVLSDSAVERAEADLERLQSRAEAYAESRIADVSIQEAVDRALSDMHLDSRRRRLLEWGLASIELEAAESLRGLSSWHADSDDEFDGDDHILPDGYDGIVAGLARPLDIRYGEHVVAIVRSRRDVVVETARGGVFRADRAVVTVPLGVLKAGSIAFDPVLPAAKRGAIRRLGMGVVNKVALVFPRAFWPEDAQFFGYASERWGEFPEILNLVPNTGRPVLVSAIAGDLAREREGWSDQAMVDRKMEILRTIFGDRIPDPTGFLVTRWGTNPFSLGSYSHLPSGATPADYDRLALPVGDRLFFAGEATERRYPATVHGAYLSGVRAASQIRRAARAG